VSVARTIDPRRLVFVDEMDTNISLSELYAFALKGRRAYVRVLHATVGRILTLLASMSLKGIAFSENSSPILRKVL